MKTFWRGLFWLNWIIILSFWLYGSRTLLFAGSGETLIALGRLAGLSAGYMILVQFFLVGRNPLLERHFGLDTLTRVHHTHGKTGILLLLLHPVFLVTGYALLTESGLWGQFLILFQSKYVPLAVIALVLFVSVVVLSLYAVRSKLRYEAWYWIHLLVYGAIFLSFWHQFANGGTLLSSRVFYVYWIVLYLLVFLSHIVFRWARPLQLLYKHRFSVNNVVRESPSAVSLTITGRKIESFRIMPGQFMILRFLARGYWQEAHPFSLSKIPDGRSLRITVKELGDFTSRVKNIPLGTPVLLEGPYGVFTQRKTTPSKVLLIAGGIGITPLRSLCEELLKAGKEVTLLYGNRFEDDIVFLQELKDLERKYPLTLVHILSEEKARGGETGYIDEEKIMRLVPDVLEREVYVCGPAPMMDKVIPILQKRGIPRKRIHFEKFSLHG